MGHSRILPIPQFYHPDRVGKIWKVDYEQRADQARRWSEDHSLLPADQDSFKVNLLLVDVQNTFCIPEFELFVGGRSGMAAVEDNDRLCKFIYQNLGRITEFTLTMDTHHPIQVFHAIYLVDDKGMHPDAYTLVSLEEIRSGKWRFNPAVASSLGIDPQTGQADLMHYVAELAQRGKYQLTIWPFHAMLGGIGHALVPAIEEAVFFHSIARYSQPNIEIKGSNPFTEHYSVVGPEVTTNASGEQIGQRNPKFIEKLQQFDATLVAGQAKSHCVASTVSDLLEDIMAVDPALAGKVYLLEDCTSPVVVPGMDYTEQADAAYARFAQAGMTIIQSDDPVDTWYPG